MGYKGDRKDLVDYGKSNANTLGRVSIGKAPGASYSSGKGIPKTKTGGQSPAYNIGKGKSIGSGNTGKFK